MTDRLLSQQQADDQLEPVDDHGLHDYLADLAPHIGWVIIYFNSLEDGVSRCIREALLRDPIQDERMDVFLSEMLFAAKCRSLMHLYGQLIESGGVKVTQDELISVERVLLECSKRRNEYAHADWTGIRKEGYVRVKSQSKRLGIVHRYKKFNLIRLQEDIEYIDDARGVLDELILPPYFRTRAIRNVASARTEPDAVGQRDAA